MRKSIRIEDIELDPENPRRKLETEDLEKSMSSEGFKENFPITVRPIKGAKQKYRVVYGNRRTKAAQKVGISQVAAVVEKMDDQHALIEALKENILRKNLDPIDEALSFIKLKQQYGMTNEDIARMLCKTEAHVRNRLDLLDLDESIQKFVGKKTQDGVAKLPLRKAEHISEIKDGNIQRMLAAKILTDNLGITDVKRLVDRLKKVRNKEQAARLIGVSIKSIKGRTDNPLATLDAKFKKSPEYGADQKQKKDRRSEEVEAMRHMERYVSDLASWLSMLVATSVEMDSQLRKFDFKSLYKLSQDKKNLRNYIKDIVQHRSRILKFYDSDVYKKLRGLSK